MAKLEDLWRWLKNRVGQESSTQDLSDLSLHHEALSKIHSNLLNIQEELKLLSENKPLLKTIVLSEIPEEKANEPIASVYREVKEFYQKCQKHNEHYDAFIQAYVGSGLSLVGIKTYDPVKMRAYQQVAAQYELLLGSDKDLIETVSQLLSKISQMIEKETPGS